MRPHRIATLFAVAFVSLGPDALAQVSFDPPTSINPPPNVMLLFDNTRTNLINGATCRGLCHNEAACGSHGGESDCSIYRNGETRVQLARRALTGGFGWLTNRMGPDGLSADAHVRTDGIMDKYLVNWGVAWFDGLGTRLAIDPTNINDNAQKAVIDYHQTPNDTYGPGGNPQLNSFLVYPRTTQCCGNTLTSGAWSHSNPGELPWFDEAADASGRVARALRWVEDYWRTGVSAPAFAPGPKAAAYPMWFSPGPDPSDENTIDADRSNVLVSPGAAGCRRNFTILLSDENGAGSFNGESASAVAARIHDMPGPGGIALPESKRNKVFHIHFGVQHPFTGVADTGADGVADNQPLPFQAAPGGVLSIGGLLASFGSVFSIILAGRYNGAPPTIDRLGDNLVRTWFRIPDCAVHPALCNLGRPAQLEWHALNPVTGAVGALIWDAGDILRARPHSDRSLFTGYYAGHANAPTDSNCGARASCSARSAAVAAINDANLGPMYGGPTGVTSDVVKFLRGDPTMRFDNGAYRGDSNGDNVVDDPFKLSDLLNSRPVIVGAPPGVGEDSARWRAFRESPVVRSPSVSGGDGAVRTVETRDQVLYVGGNDGFLHAFLIAEADAAHTPPGSDLRYRSFSTNCPSVSPPGAEIGPSPATCGGKELWAYSPRLLQSRWAELRSGHTYMVDATPVVEDVLFTKNFGQSGLPCRYYAANNTSPGCSSTQWEYRTVLVQCLSGGGPGCFALDVTNPWVPALLWERSLTSVSGKLTSSSSPFIARMKRTVTVGASTVDIPYYVALMGGGFKEINASNNPKGSFIGIGVEDGAVFVSSTTANMDFASGPVCLDADGDSYTDTCYIVSRNASVWKIQMPDGRPGVMNMVELFRGRDASAANNANIVAFTRPVVTPTIDDKMAIFFATGNVLDVPNSHENDFLFKVFDLNPARDMTPWNGLIGGTLANTARQQGACAPGGPAQLTELSLVHEGTFALNAGEKVLFDPVLVGRSVLFTSYTPNANPCLVGSGYLYGLRYDSCDVGLDAAPDPNRTPDDGRVDLGTGIPSGLAVGYGSGTLALTRSDTQFVNPGVRPPEPEKTRLFKLRWRRGG